VPAAISSLAESGFLDSESVAVLMTIRDDYGDEIVWQCNRAVLEDDARQDAMDVFLALNAIRPLDHPTLWPLWPLEEVPGDQAVQRAIALLYQDTIRRGCKIQWWEITAFWFAVQLVRVSSRLHTPLPRVQLARDHVALWRESIRTALAWFITGGFEEKHERPQDGHPDLPLWLGFKSDLRHAGVFREAEVLRTAWRGDRAAWAAAQSAFPGLWVSCCAGLDDIAALGTFGLPSNMQSRLGCLDEDLTEGPPRGDAWEPVPEEQ
jgi:hypothetical protein